MRHFLAIGGFSFLLRPFSLVGSVTLAKKGKEKGHVKRDPFLLSAVAPPPPPPFHIENDTCE